MRSVGIIFVQGFFQFGAQRADAVGDEAGAIVEFISENPVRALDAAVIFGPGRWQYEQRDAVIGTGLFEFGHEL